MEEQKNLPPEQLYCCSEYRQFVQVPYGDLFLTPNIFLKRKVILIMRRDFKSLKSRQIEMLSFEMCNGLASVCVWVLSFCLISGILASQQISLILGRI